MPYSIMWNYDGKDDPESHRVFMVDDTGDTLVPANLSCVYGTGKSYKEALSNYIKILDHALEQIFEYV